MSVQISFDWAAAAADASDSSAGKGKGAADKLIKVVQKQMATVLKTFANDISLVTEGMRETMYAVYPSLFIHTAVYV